METNKNFLDISLVRTRVEMSERREMREGCVTEMEKRVGICDLREMKGEVGGWGRDPFSRNFMKPTPRWKWYLTTKRRFH